MDRANIWSTQHLVEFVAAVGSFTDERSAIHRALELAAEALEAELGFVVRGDEVVASIGIPAGQRPHPTMQVAVTEGLTSFDAASLGPCRALHVPLHEMGDGRMVLVRQGDDPFTQTEISLAGGMARVLTLSLRTLRLLEAERALREQSERQAREALHDSLTGLPNRGLFLERLEHALARREAGTGVALLFIDMDGFKLVNDSLGHPAGDRLLVAVAERLLACVPPGGVASRLGGDEFAVLIEVAGAVEAVEVAECTLLAMERPFELSGREVFITASIGIAVADGPGMTSLDLLRSADVAMYQAKSEGRGGYSIFEPRMHDQAMRRLELEAELRRAVRGQELVLYFQPIVDLRAGRVAGIEALVRWKHPELDLVPPLDFVPMAEETGLIVPIGTWVLEEACRLFARLVREQPAAAELVLSVNVSARQFRQADLVDVVAAALAATGLDADRLVLEITESVFLEHTPQIAANLAGLRALGIRLAVDDFGTGYSSLGYLQRMPVNVLKIDKTFVDAIESGGAALVRAVVNLGHSLGLESTAEGVETAEQYQQLRALGCDRAQGYLVAPPLPFEELVEFFEDALAGDGLAWVPVAVAV
jgi:diguanylate cyclase (GGDEF)-like protein